MNSDEIQENALKLDEWWARMQQGKATLADAAIQDTKLAQRLAAAQLLSQYQELEAPAALRQERKANLLARLPDRPNSEERAGFVVWLFRIFQLRWQRPTVRQLAFGGLAALVISFSLVLGSAQALPGQPLYSVKLGWESVNVNLTDSTYRLTLAERRLHEALSMQAKDQNDAVANLLREYEREINAFKLALANSGDASLTTHWQLVQHEHLALIALLKLGADGDLLTMIERIEGNLKRVGLEGASAPDPVGVPAPANSSTPSPTSITATATPIAPTSTPEPTATPSPTAESTSGPSVVATTEPTPEPVFTATVACQALPPAQGTACLTATLTPTELPEVTLEPTPTSLVPTVTLPPPTVTLPAPTVTLPPPTVTLPAPTVTLPPPTLPLPTLPLPTLPPVPTLPIP